ncbi:MAG: hypothetical protein ACI4FO_08510 [Acutalibacteraceae bacterium]
MNINESIEKTRESFEQSFGQKSYYNKQTSDYSHLSLLLEMTKAANEQTLIDLGCWAHCRRRFTEAVEVLKKEERKNSNAANLKTQ